MPIRVLIIVDSLSLGGTESVAVNLANHLAENPELHIFLMAGRAEGPLVNRISNRVSYSFLNRKRLLDVAAISRLHQFIKKHRIQIVHAHSTSMYYPVLLKFFCNFKLVWHDHYGQTITPNGKRFYPYIFFSRWFNYAIAVNEPLLKSNQKHLHLSANKQSYLPNYAVAIAPSHPLPVMRGSKQQRLVCLANLRPQKDHYTLVKAFKIVLQTCPNAVLYCIGICMGDAYEKQLRQMMEEMDVAKAVVITGPVENPFDYLSQCTIGVLSSQSEGLPLSLLEYGLANLPVVCTQVGQCNEVLQNGAFGKMVPPNNANELANAILWLLQNETQRNELSNAFHAYVQLKYSKEAVIDKLVKIYKEVLA